MALDNSVLRFARPEDIHSIQKLENSVFLGDRLSRRSLGYFIKSPASSMFVVDYKQVLIGYALLSFRKGSSLARLYSIAIEPTAAGKGIGRWLLHQCEDHARKRHAQKMRLEVRADNLGAIQLYRNSGYQFFASVDDYYEDGMMALRFEKILQTQNLEHHRTVPSGRL